MDSIRAGCHLPVVPPGGGEIIGDAADRRVEILADGDELHVTWSRFGPGRDGADLHVHRRHSDLFYVLEGELTLRLGPAGDEVAVPAGTLARMPPGVVHGFRNAGGAELRYLNIHAPGVGFADYMRSIRDGDPITYDQFDPPADGGAPASQAVIGDVAAEREQAGLRVRLLADVEAIAVAELHAGSGAPAGLHVHDDRSEFLYVLEGDLALVADGRGLRAPVGTWVQIPAGVEHSRPAAASERVRLLAIHAPGGGIDEFAEPGARDRRSARHAPEPVARQKR
jgi:mannose-6-phosphate isomerase-like protein (cupin superfamily)